MEKIWLKSYPAQVPAEINPDEYASLVEVFQASCQEFSHLPALANLGTSLTYQEFNGLTRDFAAYLQKELRLTPGERIAIMMPNLLQYPIAVFGALRAGLVVVNVNPLYTAPELIHQLNDSGTSVLIVLENFAATVEKALPQIKLQTIITTQVGDLFPRFKRLFINFGAKYLKRMVPRFHLPNPVSFRMALNKGKNLKLEPVVLNGQNLAFLQYTGGTTGLAKGAMLTHRNLVANILQNVAWIEPFLKRGQGIIVTALPLYHIFSLTANLLTFLKMGAQNVLITNPRDFKGFIKQLKKLRFTAFTGVNTLFHALLNFPSFEELDFSHLRLTLGGGMAIQHTVAQHWEEVTKKPLLGAYGLTEASPAVTINPLTVTSFNDTVGLPIPSTDVCFLDHNDKEVPMGEPGELCVKGPQVMLGYWHNSEETKQVFTDNGYLRTGDVAVMDEGGFIRIVDRKKDMIKVSGFNVYPNEVEDVLVSNPKVLEAAVIGTPNENTGESVKAFIVKKDPGLTKDELIDFCHQNLTRYKVPKDIEFRDSLPKSNIGKILRRELE